MWFNKTTPADEKFAKAKPADTVYNNEGDGYTVGIADDQRTILKMTAGYTTLTMMTPDATAKLIRLLEATLPIQD